MSEFHDRELFDTITVTRRNGKRAPGIRSYIRTPAQAAQVRIADETYRRIRAACSEFSPAYTDLDQHAAQITLEVHRARASSRVPWPREKR